MLRCARLRDGFYLRAYNFQRPGDELTSYRAASKSRGRGDRRKIRRRPKVRPTATNFLRKRRRPRAAAQAWSCGIWGIRLFLCHRPGLRTGDGIVCRCTRKWAWTAPIPIRINLWGVRKSQNLILRTPRLLTRRRRSLAILSRRDAGWAVGTCRRSPVFCCAGKFLCRGRRKGWWRLRRESRCVAGATGKRRIAIPR